MAKAKAKSKSSKVVEKVEAVKKSPPIGNFLTNDLISIIFSLFIKPF